MIEQHRERCASFGQCTQGVFVAEFMSGTFASITMAFPYFLVVNFSAPLVEIAYDGADVPLRRHHLNLHDRLDVWPAELLVAFLRDRVFSRRSVGEKAMDDF
jgi:hypothetical protein